MKLGIVGGGVVGSAMCRAFVEHVGEVRVYDVVKERRTHSQEDACECDVVFVCLPTPQHEDSLACNTGYVEEFFSWAASFHGETNFVLRSTVPVGFTRRMVETYGLTNLVHSPEFLTARCATVDAHMPARNVIGYVNGVPLVDAQNPVGDLYARRWPHIPVIHTTSNTSEFAKLALNSFFSTKVAFFNEAQEGARETGARWGDVMEIIRLDGRVNMSHTQVPGPDGKYGYGGACLPKDLANFIDCAAKAGASPTLCEAARLRNIHDRQRKS